MTKVGRTCNGLLVAHCAPADEERSIRVFAQLLSDQIDPTIALRPGRVVESTGKCLNE